MISWCLEGAKEITEKAAKSSKKSKSKSSDSKFSDFIFPDRKSSKKSKDWNLNKRLEQKVQVPSWNNYLYIYSLSNKENKKWFFELLRYCMFKKILILQRVSFKVAQRELCVQRTMWYIVDDVIKIMYYMYRSWFISSKNSKRVQLLSNNFHYFLWWQ